MGHLAKSFAWADVVVDTLLQRINAAELQHQTVLGSCRGTDTDFSGGACAWECAATMIQAASAHRGLYLDLCPQTICEPLMQKVFQPCQPQDSKPYKPSHLRSSIL